MQQHFDDAVAQERFSLRSVFDNAFTGEMVPIEPYRTQVTQVYRILGPRDGRKVFFGMLRNAFFIEPVKKPKIETTKFAVRWSQELAGDPRFASFDECKRIFDGLLTQLLVHLQEADNVTALKEMVNNNNVAYEIPVDYISRTANPIHVANNIEWRFTELPKKVVKLRQYLTSPNNPYSTVFIGVYKKLNVKTYLTDRVLTGLHKTNREKRWECHPDSVHFALRKTAWEIEYKLMRQVCHFQGFPEDLKEKIIEDEIFDFDDEVARCPITYEPMIFAELRNEIENTTHGKSNFQVGHMHPLKADPDDEVSGHTAANISWISEQGNRIQGSNSVEFTRNLIRRIFQNYEAAGLLEEEEEPED